MHRRPDVSGASLEEVLATGRGTERSFNHDPSVHGHPTASVNVLKNVWVCYSCHDKGAVDSGRVPSDMELIAMLQPDEAARSYPQSWLSLFNGQGYWNERFPDWVCWLMGFGEDPFTGEGTYPVHTPGGQLAGVCRRALTEGPWPKYKYPRNWSASRALFGTHGKWPRSQTIALFEGAADAAAGWEIGLTSFATYGSGLHIPQIELITRMNPDVILLGQDNDDAGNAGAAQAMEDLSYGSATVHRIDWGQYNDPADAPTEDRLTAVLDVLPGRYYDLVRMDMELTVTELQQMFNDREDLA